MRIRQADVAELHWPLRVPLHTARATVRERRGLALRLIADSATVGLGEASPAPWVGGETVEAARASLDEVAALVRRGVTAGVGLAWGGGALADALADALAGRLVPSAAFALDCALLDLEAGERGVAIADLLVESDPRASSPRQPHPGAATSIRVSALLMATSPAAAANEAAACAARGFSTCKLKVGRARLDLDLERIVAVSRALPPSARVRLDANQAWTAADANRVFARLGGETVEFVEEPLADPSPTMLAELRGRHGVRVALDESIDSVTRLEELAAARALDVVVVKAARLGGLRPALRLARRARDLGLDVVVTDSLEGPIAMAAAVELAAALPEPRRAIGLAGARLLDVAVVPAWLRAARISLPRPELGLSLRGDAGGEGSDA